MFSYILEPVLTTAQTKQYTFGNILDSSVTKRLSWIVENGLLTSSFINRICTYSLTYFYSDFTEDYAKESIINDWSKAWVDNEYKATLGSLKKATPIQQFPTSNQKFFVDRYHFDEMLKTLDDDQFTDEFNQCLFAYEHEKWFLCAAGLGSCLEHLMEKIIINYNKKGYKTLRNLGKDPTFKDYLTIFRKPPINMEPRQETYIKMLSMARNSVDHHNTGYTQKNICDSLLDGIRNVFNDYYPSSILVKDAPKGGK